MWATLTALIATVGIGHGWTQQPAAHPVSPALSRELQQMLRNQPPPFFNRSLRVSPQLFPPPRPPVTGQRCFASSAAACDAPARPCLIVGARCPTAVETIPAVEPVPLR